MIHYDELSDEDKEKAAEGNFNQISLNKERIFDTFVNVLNFNSLSSERRSVDLTKYIDKLMIVDEDGLIINYQNSEGQRKWTDVIPYLSEEGEVYFLSDASPNKDEVIMNIIRRNLVIENQSSNLICIPFEDEFGSYKPVKIGSFLRV